MDVDEDDIQPASSLPSLPIFPRPSVFPDPLRPSPQSMPLDSSAPALGSMVASLSSAAAWTSTPFDLRRGHVESTNQRLAAAPDMPDNFDDMLAQSEALKRRYGADISDAEEGEEHKPSSMRRAMAAACDELVLDIALSAHLSSTRSMDPNPPPPVINAPHPPEEPPPALHFTHFRPRRHVKGRPVHSDNDSSDDEGEASNWKKPSLKSAGVRALLSEWHIGSNPQSYAWSNPYADEQAKDDPFASHSQKDSSQSQRKRQRDKSSAAPSQSQATTFSFGFSSSQATPTVASSQPATQPLQQRTRIPTILEEAPSSPSAPSFAASQPNPFALGPRGSGSFDSQSQRSPSAFGPAASQILPGAFGGREGKKEKDKKKAKKRVSGF